MWTHDEYLDRLDADAHVRTVIATHEQFLRDVLPALSFGHMFIGNGAPPGGPPFGGLWYFTDTYRVLVTNFLIQPQFQISRAGPVEDCVILFDNWEPGHPGDESFLKVAYRDPFNAGAGAVAKGLNCTQLFDIAKHFLLPKLRLA